MKKILLTFLAVAVSAVAGEFKPGQVPANAQWFLHVDVSGFKKTQLGKFGLEQTKAFAPFIDGFAEMIQFDPRKDLYGITVFGTVTEGEGEVQAKGAVMVHGNFNQPHLLSLLSTNETFKKEQAKGFEIFSWSDKEKQSYGAFSGRNHLLVGDNRGLLIEALQVLRGEAPALKAAEVGNLAKGDFFLLSSRTKGLPFPAEAKVLEHVRGIGVTVGEFDKNLVVSARVTAADDEVITLIQKSVEGLLAVARLLVWEAEDANLQELEALLREVAIVKQKNTVVIRLAVPVKKILDLARERLADN